MKPRTVLPSLALTFLMAIVGTSVTVAAPVIVNGSFEDAASGFSTPAGDFDILASGSTAIDGWIVGGNGIDWVNTFWDANDGQLSLDLSSTGAGSISQNITGLELGKKYRIDFDLAGNPLQSDDTDLIKLLDVSIDGSTFNFSFDTAGKTSFDMGWESNSLTFTYAGNSSTLTFTSLEASQSGPAIDNVSIVPIPPALWLFGSSLLGIVGISRKKKAA